MSPNKGVLEGKVTALGDAWIEVQDKDRRKVRYHAPWRGGNPAAQIVRSCANWEPFALVTRWR